ncbi:MAG: aminotransferase [Acidimicrobiaceae bacterium]|nr:aminotransferase [Acidimicrobiaceae bacterium]
MASNDPFGLRSLDIDALRRRRGAKWQAHPAPFAAWVADMDFEVAPPIAAALHELVDAHELGYPNWGGPYARSPAAKLFPARMAERYGWDLDSGRVHDLVDVIQGVRAAIHHRTEPGDGIVLHLPAYHPFLDSIEPAGRHLIGVGHTGDGFDYDDLDERLGHDRRARLWILCHPHNPLGHGFDVPELERIAEIALRHDLVVVSDEIHADLTLPGHTHVPFASLSSEVAARTITVTSASKAFNLAGLRWAVVHAGDREFHDALDALPGHYLGAPNLMGVTAAAAAWTEGDGWLDAVVDVLDGNRHLLVDLLAEHLPGVGYRPPDATYLAWLDVSTLDLGDDPAAVFRERGVELSPGAQFGRGGEGHVRLNFATSPAVLRDLVTTMAG